MTFLKSQKKTKEIDADLKFVNNKLDSIIANKINFMMKIQVYQVFMIFYQMNYQIKLKKKIMIQYMIYKIN